MAYPVQTWPKSGGDACILSFPMGSNAYTLPIGGDVCTLPILAGICTLRIRGNACGLSIDTCTLPLPIGSNTCTLPIGCGACAIIIRGNLCTLRVRGVASTLTTGSNASSCRVVGDAYTLSGDDTYTLTSRGDGYTLRAKAIDGMAIEPPSSSQDQTIFQAGD